jgi:GT2 family glycosyltransferase
MLRVSLLLLIEYSIKGDLFMFDEKISIIIPFKPDNGYRNRNWSWIKKKYEILMPQAEICMGFSNDECFSKAKAINSAAKLATRDIFVIADADIIIDINDLKKSIEELRNFVWIIPYSTINYLTDKQTTQLQKKNFNTTMNNINFTGCLSYTAGYIGGINIIPRKYFEYVGGFDESFKGWGCEDDAFQNSVDTLCGPHNRLENTIWHMYHPKGSRENYKKNYALFYKYYGNSKVIVNNYNEKLNLNKNELLKKETKSKIDASIIIYCKNQLNTLKSTIDSLMSSHNRINYEIIVVDDNSIDGSADFLEYNLNKGSYNDITLINTPNIGTVKARNYAAKISKGNYLFFCDAGINVPKYWLDNLLAISPKYKASIIAPSILTTKDNITNYGMTFDSELTPKSLINNPKIISEIPFVYSSAFCINRAVFKKINGFNEFFDIYGSEYFELCLKAWLYGYKVVVAPDITVNRYCLKNSYSLSVGTSYMIFNMLCTAYCHFKKSRIAKIVDTVKNNYFFYTASDNIKFNIDLIFKWREKYFNERLHSDDFFFDKFNIPF